MGHVLRLWLANAEIETLNEYDLVWKCRSIRQMYFSISTRDNFYLFSANRLFCILFPCVSKGVGFFDVVIAECWTTVITCFYCVCLTAHRRETKQVSVFRQMQLFRFPSVIEWFIALISYILFQIVINIACFSVKKPKKAKILSLLREKTVIYSSQNVLPTMANPGVANSETTQSCLALWPCHVHVLLPGLILLGEKTLHHLLSRLSVCSVLHLLQVSVLYTLFVFLFVHFPTQPHVHIVHMLPGIFDLGPPFHTPVVTNL